MITEDLHAFLADFGVELEFLRESAESSSSSSSSSAADMPVLTAKFILDEPELDTKIYDRSFFDARVYNAIFRSHNVTLYGVEADLTSLMANDYTMIDSVKWYVIGRLPDGTGLEQIIISRQAVRPE